MLIKQMFIYHACPVHSGLDDSAGQSSPVKWLCDPRCLHPVAPVSTGKWLSDHCAKGRNRAREVHPRNQMLQHENVLCCFYHRPLDRTNQMIPPGCKRTEKHKFSNVHRRRQTISMFEHWKSLPQMSYHGC